MKFEGNGTVWDGANNKVLCRFENGEFETGDKRVQSMLIEKGYPCYPENLVEITILGDSEPKFTAVEKPIKNVVEKMSPEKSVEVKIVEIEPVDGWKKFEVEKPIKKVVKK